jgi:hypothetical protein
MNEQEYEDFVDHFAGDEMELCDFDDCDDDLIYDCDDDFFGAYDE